jgi:ribose transport system substrate-binding protein
MQGTSGFSSNGPIGRRRFIQGAASLGLGAAALAACGGSDEAAEEGEEPVEPDESVTTEAAAEPETEPGVDTPAVGPTSGLIGLTLNGLNDYTRGVVTGVYKAFEGTDFEVSAIQANYSAETELSNIENFLAQGAVGVVIQPNTAESAGAGAKAAFDQGVPVGNCIWPGPSDADEFFNGVAEIDSVEGGRIIGRYLLEQLPDGGKIVVVQGVVGQGFSERIDEGLDEVLEGSNLEIVVREQGFFDRVGAVEVVQNAFQANPDIVAIVDYAAAMSNGICQWMEDEGIEDVLHITSDADAEMVTWFGTPYLAATRYYSSAQTGLIAGNAVLNALRGEPVEFRTVIAQELVTAENIDAVVAENPFFFDEYASETENL